MLIMLSLASAKILVDGVDLAAVDAHYIKLKVGYFGWFKTHACAYIDYGQEGKRVVVDENGKTRAFVSRIDILNTFYKNGWEINSVVSEPNSSLKDSVVTVQTETYFILERAGDK